MPQRMGMSGVGRGRLARRGPAAVQAIHGALRPFGEEHRHGVGRDEQRLADELRVGGIRASEHVVEHRRTIARVPDTDAQPPERIAHVRDHIAHAVVAGGAATLFEPYHARGEIELVVRHQHRLDRDLVVIRDAAHRVAAAVHVAHGLEQPQILSADARTCELRLVARLAAEGRLVAAASAATGSGSSARGAWIETTGALRRVSSGIATPAGSGMSARNLVSLRLMPERSSSRNSGRSFGRQLTSTSARMCETTPPWLLTPGDTLSPLKWIGRRMRILSFSTTRCRSTCTTRFLAGCICTSLIIASSVRSPILSRTIED